MCACGREYNDKTKRLNESLLPLRNLHANVYVQGGVVIEGEPEEGDQL